MNNGGLTKGPFIPSGRRTSHWERLNPRRIQPSRRRHKRLCVPGEENSKIAVEPNYLEKIAAQASQKAKRFVFPIQTGPVRGC